MNLAHIKAIFRPLTIAATLLSGACTLFPAQQPANPLVGSWSTADHNRVSFGGDTVVLTPDKGTPITMGPGACNNRYKLQYGRMVTTSLQQSFAGQPDLQSKLKGLLTQPDYPVADVTCDQGGTTYLMLNDRQMIAVYRDGGVGGLENYSRL